MEIEDYCLSGSDIAKMLDITESYLFLKLKDEIDHIDLNTLDNDDKLKYMKTNKRILFSLKSFKRFLREYAVVDAQTVGIKVTKFDLESDFSVNAANKVIEDYIDNLKTKSDESDDSYLQLSDDMIERIVNKEIRFKSIKTMKDEMKLAYNQANIDIHTIHNMQIYRMLNRSLPHNKVIFKSAENNQSTVRYLFHEDFRDAVFHLLMNEDGVLMVNVPAALYSDAMKNEVINLLNEKLS